MDCHLRQEQDCGELLKRYAETRCPKIRNRIAELNVGLVRAIVVRYIPRNKQLNAEFDDLIQVGMLGLLTAIERFDPKLGKLSTFAGTYIEGNLNHYIRDRLMVVRIPRKQQLLNKKIPTFVSEFTRRHGRRPTMQEILTGIGITEKEYDEYCQGRRLKRVESLERTLGDADDDATIGERMAGHDPTEEQESEIFIGTLEEQLTPKQAQCIRKVFIEGNSYQETAVDTGMKKHQIQTQVHGGLKALRKFLGSNG